MVEREECKECNHYPVCRKDLRENLTEDCPYYEHEKERCLECNYPLKKRKLKSGIWVCYYCSAEIKLTEKLHGNEKSMGDA